MTISWRHKNYLLIAGTILLLVISWNMAFQKTSEAISTNRELNARIRSIEGLSDNPVYLRSSLSNINRLLETYRVDSTVWKTDFWLNVSAIASAKGAEVIYEPGKEKILPDSAAGSVMKQEMSFSAGYIRLVALLDSLEHTQGIGRISAVQVKTEEEGVLEKQRKIILRATFSALPKKINMKQ